MTGPQLEFPRELSAKVTIKIGEALSNSRTTFGNPLELNLDVSEGYTIFREKLRRKIAAMTDIVWGDDSPIMYRPSANAPQSRYQALYENDEGLNHCNI